MSASPLLTAASGLGLGLSLIVAIGAQNAFVLRSGLRGEHVAVVVSICVISDATLIVAGVGGAGLLFTRAPALVEVIRIVGAVFLFGYGLIAARKALRPKAMETDLTAPRKSLTAAVLTCLALTWLNPHVYLDTVALLGSIANTHGDQRWWFALGAAFGSLIWFTALGFGARVLRPVFARPQAWRILDGVIAVVMFAIAVTLVLGAR